MDGYSVCRLVYRIARAEVREWVVKLFYQSLKRQKGKAHTHTSYTHTLVQCVNICALAEGTHRLCSSAWQSYCCWFLKWPLQYFRLFCHCVINKETLRPKTRQLNDGSANLSGLLLHINASLTDNQMDRQTDGQTDEQTDCWMDGLSQRIKGFSLRSSRGLLPRTTVEIPSRLCMVMPQIN